VGVMAVGQIDELLRKQLTPDASNAGAEEAIWAQIRQRLGRRQRIRRRRRVGTILCAVFALLLSAGVGIYVAGSRTSPVSGSPATPTIDPVLGPGGFTVTPDTDLVNHQQVTISIHGLKPESTVWVVMCLGRPTSVQQAYADCIAAPPQAEMVDLNQRGEARLRFTVDRYLSPGGYQIDCATYAAGCSLGLGVPLSFNSARITANIQPVTFKDTPAPPVDPLRISVSPAAPFADGQDVTLSGTGFPANSTVRVAECPTDTDCGPYFQDVEASPDGTFAVSMTLHRTFTVEQGTATGGEQPVTIDCSQPLRCFLTAEEDAPPYAAASSIPTVFGPDG
jgi:hypothetical protein